MVINYKWATGDRMDHEYGEMRTGTQSQEPQLLSPYLTASGAALHLCFPLTQLEPGLILCQDLSPEGSSLGASFP